MNSSALQKHLDRVAARYRRLRFRQLSIVAWLSAVAIIGLLWQVKPPVVLSTPAALAALAGIAAVLIAIVFRIASRTAQNYSWVAHRVEAAFPELNSCLTTAVEQQPDLPDGRYGYLQSSVIRQALDHANRHAWPDVVPKRTLTLVALGDLLSFGLFVAAWLGLAFHFVAPLGKPESKIASGGAPSSEAFSALIEPGDAEVERGTSLLVLARVQGPMPADGSLIHENESGENKPGEQAQLTMTVSLDDPIFSTRIPSIDAPLTYRVQLGEWTSANYRVTVFEYPRLERADADLKYPKFAGLEDRRIQDVRTISVVEGTQVTLLCRLNKSVVTATLIDDKPVGKEPLVLAASNDDPLVYTTTIDCRESRRWNLELVDAAGRKNVKPARITLNVLPNQPPQLKPTFPARDVEVSPLEEFEVKGTAWDDFGMKRVGLSYSIAGQEPVEVVLTENTTPKKKLELAHVVRLEELKAEPDQLLSYYWWAEDVTAAGESRRTSSDMYFAEVRPFEQIYRQGEQPPGGDQQQQAAQGEGQNAQDAHQLAKLQKEIMNATWKLIRREVGSKPTAALSDDADQVRLSQAAARELAEALGQKLQDARSQQHLAEALEKMTQAIEQLEAAKDGPAVASLHPALAAEQAAYQSLLKLRAREHEIVLAQQQQRGSQSSSSSSRSPQQQEQLSQLDMKQEQNPYETQRAAQQRQEESEQERENRQVLNRLRELARRQHDLNERLKEMQASLESDDKQQEEERRRLQRLQEEQRQVLQDTEELQSRMEQPENSEQTAEQQEQLAETREQVQRAAEALEERKVSQAASAGAKAEQRFDELREEFRRRASNRFSEEVKQMRESARELERREKELGERLAEKAPTAESGKSLREEKPRDDLSQAFQEQRGRLNDLKEQMRDTIDRAQETEPLLTERLYEAARAAEEDKLDERLEAADRSLRQGAADDARKLEEAVDKGIQKMRSGIERAAEGVLGDETEALRRARDELRDLSRELKEEIQRESPEATNRNESTEPGEQQSGNEAQPGKEAGRVPSAKSGEQGKTPGEQGKSGQQSPEGKQEQGKQGEGQKGGAPSGKEAPNVKSSEGKAAEGKQGEGKGKSPGQGKGEEGNSESPASKSGIGEGSSESQEPGGQRGRASSPQNRAGGSSAGEGMGPMEAFLPRSNTSPLKGESFREWSDRLRDVEEMVEDDAVRAEAARIRERARAVRAEFKRHSAEPNWDLVREQIVKPLSELEQNVSEELLRRTTKNARVPLDRDPVPPRYSEKTRRYYERLGSGK